MSLLNDTAGMTPYEDLCAEADDPRGFPELDELERTGCAIGSELVSLITDTALEDAAEAVFRAIFNGLHHGIERLQRDVDHTHSDLRQLSRDFSGSEVDDDRIQALTATSRKLTATIAGLEALRDAAVDQVITETGIAWTPHRGSAINSARVSAACIDARDVLKARAKRTQAATDILGTIVVFRGAPNANTKTDQERIYEVLDRALKAYPDMVLATADAPGADKLAVMWAKHKGISIVRARTPFSLNDRSAPFKANEELMALEPTLVLALANSLDATSAATRSPSGIMLNMLQSAQRAGVKSYALKAR